MLSAKGFPAIFNVPEMLSCTITTVYTLAACFHKDITAHTHNYAAPQAPTVWWALWASFNSFLSQLHERIQVKELSGSCFLPSSSRSDRDRNKRWTKDRLWPVGFLICGDGGLNAGAKAAASQKAAVKWFWALAGRRGCDEVIASAGSRSCFNISTIKPCQCMRTPKSSMLHSKPEFNHYNEPLDMYILCMFNTLADLSGSITHNGEPVCSFYLQCGCHRDVNPALNNEMLRFYWN